MPLITKKMFINRIQEHNKELKSSRYDDTNLANLEQYLKRFSKSARRTPRKKITEDDL